MSSVLIRVDSTYSGDVEVTIPFPVRPLDSAEELEIIKEALNKANSAIERAYNLEDK